MQIKRSFGEVIISYCKWQDISQSAFARRLGVSRAYMSQLTTGYVTRQAGVKTPVDPSLSTMRHVAKEMGISFSQLAAMMDGNIGIDSQAWANISNYRMPCSLDSINQDQFIKQIVDSVIAELDKRQREIL